MQFRKWRALVREVLSRARRSSETCPAGSEFRDERKASPHRSGRHHCFIKQEPGACAGSGTGKKVCGTGFYPQKYENGDWRRATGQEAEYLFRRSILPEIGELRCRDLKAENLRGVLRKLAEAGLSHESVSKVRFAMGDMVKRMVAKNI